MSQSKQHANRKREISDVTQGGTDNEPKRKRRKIDDSSGAAKNNTNNVKKWKCRQCTLLNEPTVKKCIICNIPKNYKFQDDDIKIDNDDNNNGEDDIDIDNSLNKTDINIRNVDTNTLPKTREFESTLNGLQYTECWLCINCFAMNRLLDTISKYNYLCAFCTQATYSPQTDIIKSFEWDQQIVQQQQIQNVQMQTNKELLPFYAAKRENRYNTKGLNNREGDKLIMGLILISGVRQLSTIKLVPQDLIRLILLFAGDFEYDGWDTFTNGNDFVIDNGLTTCFRTEQAKELWRNCFGQREVQNENKNDNNVRYEWKLKCVKRVITDWEEKVAKSVIIGVIESKGIQTNMGSVFSSYKDGWGLCGDGQKVTDGKYENFNSGFRYSNVITITLQWINNVYGGSTCQLLFDNQFAYHLNFHKVYKLAVAMNSREYQLEWISFAKDNEIIKIK